MLVPTAAKIIKPVNRTAASTSTLIASNVSCTVGIIPATIGAMLGPSRSFITSYPCIVVFAGIKRAGEGAATKPLARDQNHTQFRCLVNSHTWYPSYAPVRLGNPHCLPPIPERHQMLGQWPEPVPLPSGGDVFQTNCRQSA